MPQFRKKPVVIEAFQITPETRASNADWPGWLNLAWQQGHDAAGSVFPSEFPDSDGTDQLVVRTLEGEMLVGWGDWIIQGVAGELYPCKPEIFAATYEPA
jgi:hypothetical protein